MDGDFLHLQETTISKAEEEKTIYEVKNGNFKNYELLISSVFKTIERTIKIYSLGNSEIFEDLFQSGLMGLSLAIKEWKPKYGLRLNTFAFPYIRREIQNESVRYYNLPTSPFTGYDLLAFKNGKNKGKKKPFSLQRRYELEILLINLTSDPKQLNDNETLARIDEISLGNFFAEEQKEEKLKKLEYLLNTLDEREKEIIEMRFGLNGKSEHKLHEIGDKYGITKERIRQIQNRILSKIRKRALT